MNKSNRKKLAASVALGCTLIAGVFTSLPPTHTSSICTYLGSLAGGLVDDE